MERSHSWVAKRPAEMRRADKAKSNVDEGEAFSAAEELVRSAHRADKNNVKKIISKYNISGEVA